jgi:hypothetical protein
MMAMTTHLLLGSSILLVSLASHAQGQSLGHYHLPSTVPQFCGLGYGAGHHAPMIRPTNCHPPRMQRYIHMPGCGACGALPMESFPTCSSPACHAQLDQLLKHGDHDYSPAPNERSLLQVTPTDVTPTEIPADPADGVLPMPNN